ncbi:MAG: alanine--glyoxylate aminotransferase family protein [Thermoproteales archaeon]|nr:alanine--glyoxylate aminotransferase family protein [Thermoproteales archaeon]RLE64108.1 MAG: alanine--glyoxylate aminotransferase family protein [Thermoprotei archaeon]
MSLDPLLFTPGPVMLPREVLQELGKQVVSHRSSDFRRIFSETVEFLKTVFKTENEIIVLTASGTGGVEASLINLLKPGERIIVPVYGVFSSRAAETASRLGINVISQKMELPEEDKILQLIEENEAEALFMVYNETSPGITVRKLAKIVEEAKSKGLLVIVDAISILGGDLLETDKWGIDVVVAGSQKCLMSPPGLSFVSLSAEAIKKMGNVPRRTFYFDFQRYLKFLKERRETPYTPAVNILYATRTALKIIVEKIGLDNWINLHKDRGMILYESLEDLKMDPIIPLGYRSYTVISVAPPNGLKADELLDLLRRKYSIYCAGGLENWKGKILRFGNMGYITRRTLLTLISALSDLLSSRGININLSRALNRVSALKDVEWQSI